MATAKVNAPAPVAKSAIWAKSRECDRGHKNREDRSRGPMLAK